MAGDEGYPQHEVEQQAFPGHSPDDEIYHTYTDDQGQTIKQYDMDSEEIVVTPGVHADWNAVVGQMITIAQERADAQIPYVQAAIAMFQDRSGNQIAQFVRENTPPPDEIGWATLVDGLASGIWLAFGPEGEVGKLIFEKAVSAFSDGIENTMRSQEAHRLDDARQQLEAGVRAFSEAVHQNTLQAVDAVKSQIIDAFKQGMADQQHLTMDPTWIDEMVHYFGFPMRTQDTVTTPVLQYLEYEFTNLLTDVQAKLSAYSD